MSALKMKRPINLLPEEYGDRSKSRVSSLLVSRINKILAIVAAVLLILIGAVFVYENILLRRELDRNKFLKQDIVAREDSEQKLILVKDRLEKINEVYNYETKVDVQKVLTIINKLPVDVNVTGINISEKTLKLSLVASNSLVFAKTLGATLSKEIFETVDLTSFSFQPDIGYVITLDLK